MARGDEPLGSICRIQCSRTSARRCSARSSRSNNDRPRLHRCRRAVACRASPHSGGWRGIPAQGQRISTRLLRRPAHRSTTSCPDSRNRPALRSGGMSCRPSAATWGSCPLRCTARNSDANVVRRARRRRAASPRTSTTRDTSEGVSRHTSTSEGERRCTQRDPAARSPGTTWVKAHRTLLQHRPREAPHPWRTRSKPPRGQKPRNTAQIQYTAAAFDPWDGCVASSVRAVYGT